METTGISRSLTARMRNVIKDSGETYCTATYIAARVDLMPTDAQFFLDTSRDFHKSIIKSPKGEDIYMIATPPWSAIRDFWNYFRHINALKYRA